MGGEVICLRHGEVEWLAPHNTIRIDGPLPTVCGCACHRVLPAPLADADCNCEKYQRPLREGDRVTLAWFNADSPHPAHDRVPFATATVTKIETPTGHGYDLPCWIVTVTDVEALS